MTDYATMPVEDLYDIQHNLGAVRYLEENPLAIMQSQPDWDRVSAWHSLRKAERDLEIARYMIANIPARYADATAVLADVQAICNEHDLYFSVHAGWFFHIGGYVLGVQTLDASKRGSFPDEFPAASAAMKALELKYEQE